MTENERGCYCSLWEKDPKLLIDQGVKPGHCGICEICKKQGHLRHAPGCHPYTAAWCDKCYKVQTFINNAQCLAMPALLISLFTGYYKISVISFMLFIIVILINSKGQNLIRKISGT